MMAAGVTVETAQGQGQGQVEDHLARVVHRRRRASPALSPTSKVAARIVVVSSTPPACPTADTGPKVTTGRG